MIVVETPRLVLRWLQKTDLEEISALFAHPEVMRFSVSGPLNREQAQTMIEHYRSLYEEEGLGHWAVFYKIDKRLIGCCGLLAQSIDGKRDIEVGYRFDPRYWGKGLATEAAKAARDYGFSRLRIPRLIALVSAENPASIRVTEKLGMKHEQDTLFYQMPVRLYAMETIPPRTFDIGSR